MEINKIYCENCLDTMARMPDNFIDCVVTSPPYWNLRDYGHEDQIGLEATPEEYVSKIVQIFREVRRVLKPGGTVWLNLGDSYNGSGKASGRTWENGNIPGMSLKQVSNTGSLIGKAPDVSGLKPKDLVGIPWRVAFALQADSWWLRQDIIWAKPNPMPESVTDRCTKAHEYIFLFTKSERYFYDYMSIAEKAIYAEQHANKATSWGPNGKMAKNNIGKSNREKYQYIGDNHTTLSGGMRNRRSVWEIATEPSPEPHFASFPIKLPSLCILAGCPKNGIVYDPFMGIAKTARAALKYGRHFIGSEINPEYCKMDEKRLKPYLQQMSLF